MKKGTILDAMPWGVGRIKPADGGSTVIFTQRVFAEDWRCALPGIEVEYLTYAGASNEARRVRLP